jgi:hypothetical protein
MVGIITTFPLKVESADAEPGAELSVTPLEEHATVTSKTQTQRTIVATIFSFFIYFSLHYSKKETKSVPITITL